MLRYFLTLPCLCLTSANFLWPSYRQTQCFQLSSKWPDCVPKANSELNRGLKSRVCTSCGVKAVLSISGMCNAQPSPWCQKLSLDSLVNTLLFYQLSNILYKFPIVNLRWTAWNLFVPSDVLSRSLNMCSFCGGWCWKLKISISATCRITCVLPPAWFRSEPGAVSQSGVTSFPVLQ